MKPTLTTSRLILSPYTAGMVKDRHLLWLSDPEVVKYSEQRHREHTMETQHAYLNGFGPDQYIWLISPKTYEAIGTITAYVDAPNQTADMGIMLGAWRGKGFGLEAWQAVMGWLWEAYPELRKIECGMMFSNQPMRKLATKCGFKFEGMRWRHFLLDGKEEDCLLYGKFRP